MGLLPCWSAAPVSLHVYWSTAWLVVSAAMFLLPRWSTAPVVMYTPGWCICYPAGQHPRWSGTHLGGVSAALLVLWCHGPGLLLLLLLLPAVVVVIVSQWPSAVAGVLCCHGFCCCSVHHAFYYGRTTAVSGRGRGTPCQDRFLSDTDTYTKEILTSQN